MTLDDVLTDDAAFEAYCSKQSGMRYGPFVRANTYPEQDWGRDAFWRDFGFDPRRPVVMRGARLAMVAGYPYKSHYAYAVAERFLISRRINVVTKEGRLNLLDLMMGHFRRRGIYVHDEEQLLPRFHLGSEVCCILDGKQHWLERSHLPGLQSRLRKAGKLGSWDLAPIMRRLDELCLIRRERENREVALLLQHFKRLKAMPPERQPEAAAALLKWHEEKQRKNLTAFR